MKRPYKLIAILLIVTLITPIITGFTNYEKDEAGILRQKQGRGIKPSDLSLQTGISNPMKGTWTTPDKIVLRWTPDEEWIPEKGYNLFRTLNGKTELIAQCLGSMTRILQLENSNYNFSPYIVELYKDANLDPDKMKKIGVKSVSEFNKLVYSDVKPSIEYTKITGEQNFMLIKESLFSEPKSITERMSQVDAFEINHIHFKNEIKAIPVPLAERKALLHGNTLITEPAREAAKSEKEMIIDKLLKSRKMIMTNAFVNQQFANESGLGYEDNLEDIHMDLNAGVKYTLVPLIGENSRITPEQVGAGIVGNGSYSVTVKYGVEEPVEVPKDFMGYGADNMVSFRWKAPESEYSRSIISGYFIERKKKGEDNFTLINDIPVAISYTEEDGILYETPVFYEDKNVRNGDELVYRLQALDIFGRVSDFSEELEIKVQKVTPPDQPFLGEPVLSTRISGRTPKGYVQLFEQNKGSASIALPIARTSDDTDVFVIYRSKAQGNGVFGIPEELDRIDYLSFADELEPSNQTVINLKPINSLTLKKRQFTINPDTEDRVDVIYQDSTIEPGYYYKYWVAALDSWGNESLWSQSKVVGYATQSPPKNPTNVIAMMRHNQALEDKKELPPGFFRRYMRTEKTDISAVLEGNKSIDISGMIGNQQSQTSQLLPLQASTQPQIGFSLSDALSSDYKIAPQQVNIELDNLPNPRDVLDMVVLSNDEVSQSGSLDFTWNHYTGEGIAGYAVYRAYADGISKEALRNMSKEEALEAFDWKLKTAKTDVNQCIDTVEKKNGRLYIYMICLIPEKTYEDILKPFGEFIPAGWVKLNWDRPQDPQVSYFRVYRAEVPYFEDDQNLSALKWSMVADNLKNTVYSEKVDQTVAHYYYYKVVSVSVWGVESENGAITKYRVPSTVAPQPPAMLVPFSKKEINQINFLGVANASKYIIYRCRIPSILDKDLKKLNDIEPKLFSKMFNLDMYRDTIAKLEGSSGVPEKAYVASAAPFTIPALLDMTTTETPGFTTGISSRFKTQMTGRSDFISNLSGVSITSKLSAFKAIADEYGILGVVPYSSLDKDMAEGINWTKVGEITIPRGEDPTGKKTFYDETAVFGCTYLYTVQAVNDDNLHSDRPEPVSVFTRKGQPFPPVTNLKWERDDLNYPTISWDAAKDPNLSKWDSSEYTINEINGMNTAGYLVYRSNEKDGEYYQVSALIPGDPSLNRIKFKDMQASVQEENWYKVKVVDTAGYISDFSQPILAGIKREEIPKDVLKIPIGSIDALNPKTLIASNGDLSPSLIKSNTPTIEPKKPTVQPEVPTAEPKIPAITVPETEFTPKPELQIQPELQIPDATIAETTDLKLNGFMIKNVPKDAISAGKGEGKLVVGQFSIPVSLTIKKVSLDKTVTDGSAELLSTVTLGDTGIYFTELELKAESDAKVSGSISKPSRSIMGDLKMLEFNQSKLDPKGIIHIYSIPYFHYQNLIFKGLGKITVNFGNIGNTAGISIENTIGSFENIYGAGFINLHRGIAESNLGFETIDNTGLHYAYEMVSFDQEGRLDGIFTIDVNRTMRMVIPAGLCIKTNDSKLVYNDGRVDTARSYINGIVLTPFETFVDSIAPQPNSPAQETVINQQILDFLMSGNQDSASQYEDLLDSCLYYMTQSVQSNALLIFPDSRELEESCSAVPFRVNNWDGCGFMIQDTMMTPSGVPLYDAGKLTKEQEEEQKDAKLGITPGTVALDLRRDSYYQGQSPDDTKIPEWMGIVIKHGHISMPTKYIEDDNGKPITFTLSPGELLYDQNGFCYQNQAYTPEGIPADFESELGTYEDVIVRNIVLDLYNNMADLEIDADIGVPLFQRRLKVKLMKDDKSGLFVCNIAKTDKFDPAGDGQVKVQIDGGYMDDLGMHIDGTLDLVLEGGGKGLKLMNAAFSDLIIPADNKMNKLESEEGRGVYGTALFNKPYTVKFHDFPIQLRALSLISKPLSMVVQTRDGTGISPDEYYGRTYNTTMTLWGGMQLSDNLTMNTEKDADRIVVQGVFNSPKISYENCASEMNLNFDDFMDIKGVAISAKKSGQTAALEGVPEDVVEYDLDKLQMLCSAFSSMEYGTFKVEGRIGFDRKRDRYFFGVASYYTGPGIPYGFGEIFNMGSLFAYNMDMPTKTDGTFDIPLQQQALMGTLKKMEVNKSNSGNYVFAAAFDSTVRVLGYKIGELKNAALIVEKGPTVEMSSQFWGPTTISGLTTGNPLSPIGEAKIGYYHKNRLFKMSIALLGADMFGLSVSGTTGFELCPDYWEFYMGYPDMMMASFHGLDAGFGFAIRNSSIDDSYIMARVHVGYDTGHVDIGIVYVRGFLAVGGELGISEALDDKTKLWLSAYLQGGIEGGVVALGKRFEVISLMLNANGQLVAQEGSGWHLSAHARIRYHVDLVIKDISGSVGWHISKDF